MSKQPITTGVVVTGGASGIGKACAEYLAEVGRPVAVWDLNGAAAKLVESGHKQIIVRVNDVGPLKSGRVLDLNERSMRHFDPFLTRGLIQDVKITLLPGEDWIPGPVGTGYALDFTAGARLAAASPGFGSIDSTSWQMEPELARLRTPLAPVSYHPERGNVRAEMRPSGRLGL